MFNRFMRIVVIFSCIILMIPALIITPVTYIIFGYPAIIAVAIICTNCFVVEDWDYKKIFDDV